MRPVPLTIHSRKEVLYDTYFVGYPKDKTGIKSLTTTLFFRDFSKKKRVHRLKAKEELKIPETNIAMADVSLNIMNEKLKALLIFVGSGLTIVVVVYLIIKRWIKKERLALSQNEK